ncbi:PREDICTED: FBD-associated F-box protein At5g38590-like [Camelina sativa]|uniref:FBD-associated F-box protein At5g38590-like n=1 Tax=Camelina sativa TaxID=90675 RepID=A0ABM1QR70_CAMSA|nr:PREDICTED: FBD-associated F-box protein At5g38590-like [Camelina sativa]
MDKISGLPDAVLVKILSFLPTKVAVSSSILAKRWEFLWMLLPRLEFTSQMVTTKPGLGDFINKNMPLHRAPFIESLHLLLELSRRDSKPEDIKRWIEITVSRNVRELDIFYGSENENIFPSSLFTCKSLEVLKLKWATLMDIPSRACLPSLKILQLESVKFVDEQLLQKLLSICPVLEDLSVHCYKDHNMEEFTIIVPSLLSLSLFIPDDWLFDGYVIDTPSLNYLKLEDCNHLNHNSLIQNMPKLREAYVDVRYFLLKSVIESITSLEHLNLCVCKRDSSNLLGQYLLKDSPKLRVLDISIVGDHGMDERNGMVCWNQPSPVPECLLSSLQIFNWSRYFGRPQDRDIAVYILKNARHLKKATILADRSEHFVPNVQMIKELALSPRASIKCQVVFVEDLKWFV